MSDKKPEEAMTVIDRRIHAAIMANDYQALYDIGTELSAATARADDAELALKGVSGALADAATVKVPANPLYYGDAVRELTAERDRLVAHSEDAMKALAERTAERDEWEQIAKDNTAVAMERAAWEDEAQKQKKRADAMERALREIAEQAINLKDARAIARKALLPREERGDCSCGHPHAGHIGRRSGECCEPGCTCTRYDDGATPAPEGLGDPDDFPDAPASEHPAPEGFEGWWQNRLPDGRRHFFVSGGRGSICGLVPVESWPTPDFDIVNKDCASCARRVKSERPSHGGTVDSDSKMDLDDCVAGHPVAMRELKELRDEALEEAIAIVESTHPNWRISLKSAIIEKIRSLKSGGSGGK